MRLGGVCVRDKGETLELKSKLSIKEIEENFKGVDFFAGLMAGLDEAVKVERLAIEGKIRFKGEDGNERQV